jgi:hypothetical protein
MASFESEQQADRDQLAGIQLGLAMLGYLFHPIIDKAEHMDDNVFGGHSNLSFRECFCSSLLDMIGVTTSTHLSTSTIG